MREVNQLLTDGGTSSSRQGPLGEIERRLYGLQENGYEGKGQIARTSVRNRIKAEFGSSSDENVVAETMQRFNDYGVESAVTYLEGLEE